MNRRTFIKNSTVAAAIFIPFSARNQQSAAPFAFDAMGEIRTAYTPELIKEILASGTRAIAITLSDPKILGHAGYEDLLAEIKNHDAYFARHPDLFIKATSLAHVDQAP